MSAPCPRCKQSLREEQVDEFPVRLCSDCKGMLLGHADLTRVLEQSWHTVPERVAEDTPFRVPDDVRTEPLFHCPDCRQLMEKYGYMGLKAVQIDRCESCALVWLDADEFQNMILAMAKDNYRSQSAYKEATKNRFDPVAGSLIKGEATVSAWLWDDAMNNAVRTTKSVGGPLVAQAIIQLLLG